MMFYENPLVGGPQPFANTQHVELNLNKSLKFHTAWKVIDWNPTQIFCNAVLLLLDVGSLSCCSNISRALLLRQIWIVNYYVKCWSDYLSNENINTGVFSETIFHKYQISSYSFHRNYSFLNLEIQSHST